MLDFLKTPYTAAILYALLFFGIAFVLHITLFFLLHRFLQKKNVLRKLIQELRFPILFILLEIAAGLSLNLFNLPKNSVENSELVLNLLLIGTIGWCFAGTLRALFRAFVEKNRKSIASDIQQRALYTQILFLYRFGTFLVFAVTLALILLSFPYIRSVGIGILGSAGIAGIALGLAARPILLNIIAGFQIAVTKMLKIGDAIFVEGTFARVEEIHLTRVVVCTQDLRRIVIPISNFIDKSFENWDLTNPELITDTFIYCDFTMPIEALRKKAGELLGAHPLWNRKSWKVEVTKCNEQSMEVRIAASINDASSASELRAFLRETLLEFIRQEYPDCLPRQRVKNLQ